MKFHTPVPWTRVLSDGVSGMQKDVDLHGCAARHQHGQPISPSGLALQPPFHLGPRFDGDPRVGHVGAHDGAGCKLDISRRNHA